MDGDVIKQWNDAAVSFAREQERSIYARANKAVVKERFKSLNGEHILDLGCGYGYYTDYFRSIGGCPVGIDGAENMIRIAKEYYPSCAFSLADITRPFPFDPGSFDIVFCNQVLMDIDNTENVFKESRRVLKNGGILFFSIVHPAFYNGIWQTGGNGRNTGKLIFSYLTPHMSVNHFWGETAHFHRPISYYLNAAAGAGLILTRAGEPRSYGGTANNDDLPLFFFAEYVKP